MNAIPFRNISSRATAHKAAGRTASNPGPGGRPTPTLSCLIGQDQWGSHCPSPITLSSMSRSEQLAATGFGRIRLLGDRARPGASAAHHGRGGPPGRRHRASVAGACLARAFGALPWGELAGLWRRDIDLDVGTIRVSAAATVKPKRTSDGRQRPIVKLLSGAQLERHRIQPSTTPAIAKPRPSSSLSADAAAAAPHAQ